jgi:hypothetical protein
MTGRRRAARAASAFLYMALMMSEPDSEREPGDPDAKRDLARRIEGRKRRSIPRPMADIVEGALADTFRRQGFASAEIVTRWPDIVGAELARLCEPLRIAWSQTPADRLSEPATLILRVEGPVAVEVQHQSAVIVERVNQTLGWPAIGRVAIRQEPLKRRDRRKAPAPPDPKALARAESALSDVHDEGLKAALARLSVAITRG